MYLDRDPRGLRPSLPVNGSFDGVPGKGLRYPDEGAIG